MTVGEALGDNKPPHPHLQLQPEEQQEADNGAVVETDIFAWHDKSFLLVLCFAGKETEALCADVGLKGKAREKQRNRTS